jgi:hypothetical protein
MLIVAGSLLIISILVNNLIRQYVAMKSLTVEAGDAESK